MKVFFPRDIYSRINDLERLIDRLLLYIKFRNEYLDWWCWSGMFQYSCFILFCQIFTRTKFIFGKVDYWQLNSFRNLNSCFFSRPIQRAPRALTADIIRVPFIQDTINLIRRSHQTYFDFSAFIDGKIEILFFIETNYFFRLR